MEFLDAPRRRVVPLSGDGENQSGDVDEVGKAKLFAYGLIKEAKQDVKVGAGAFLIFANHELDTCARRFSAQ
jgi:hypothetical protein